jgi:GNAT superfamily N-acetyltransferase
VSRSEGEVTGFISAEAGSQDPKSLMSPPVPHVNGAFLKPEKRGTGAADALFAALLSWMHESGWKSATVDFETSNPEGSGFWLGPAGFTPLLYTMVRRLDPRYVGGTQAP